MVFHGVRDFLHWNYLFDWPVFNLADCCLVCGAGLLLLQAFGSAPAPADQGVTAAARGRYEGTLRPEPADVSCAGVPAGSEP